MNEERGKVRFLYKDYADGGRQKRMRLDLGEFLRRFCLHVLLPRFVKIRHYGILSNRCRKAQIEKAPRAHRRDTAKEEGVCQGRSRAETRGR